MDITKWRRSFAWVFLLGSVACGRHAAKRMTHADATATAAAGAQRQGSPCGELACNQYHSATDAFLEAIASRPLVLGIGETHAPRGATVPSAARRFTDDLLPLLAERASDLLLELMMSPRGCPEASIEARAKQQVVTSRQAETNQGEYVAMGERARALGIVPDMLRPDCDDVSAMRGDGLDTIDTTLEITARLTLVQAKRLVVRNAQSQADSGKMVVIYGGALHNDLAPRAEAARWSYAPELDAYVHGRFVELDLVVPEFIGDDETWRSLPWWTAYDSERLGGKPTLFRTGDRSFVLVFARTPRSALGHPSMLTPNLVPDSHAD